MSIVCRPARTEDFPALAQLLEFYQYDLCDIWPQDMDGEARYGYNLRAHQQAVSSFAHVACVGDQHAGFALVAPARVTRTQGWWMEQFFIHKRHRHSGAGLTLARHAFAAHPGPWEVGQMPDNLAAQAFWRKVISQVTSNNFVELRVSQGSWQGVVQQFDMPASTCP
jgi:predicted acetyltransferase